MNISEQEELRQEVSKLVQQISGIGFLLHGILRKHYMKSGHLGCKCHSEPPQLHSPYCDWTRRVDGKIKTIRFTEEQALLIEKWISNMRKVEMIIDKVEKLSLAAFEKIKKRI
ncbi:MAG: DUF6788 family protein [Thermoplasmataceae archaeon]